MEYIRKAANYKKISFLGYSYGTQLGSIYLMLYPDHVDKMVLDGNMNPDHSLYNAVVSRSAAFQNALGNMLNLCNKNPSCVLYPNAQESYNKAASLIASGQIIRRGEVVTLEAFYSSLRQALPRVNNYPAILSTIKSVLDSHVIDDRLKADVDNDLFVNAVVLNSDFDKNGLKTYQEIFNLASNYWNKYQFSDMEALIGIRIKAWYNSKIYKPLPKLIYNNSIPKVIVIGNYYDPATSFNNSLSMASLIPDSTLVALDSGNHCAYNTGVSKCVDDYVNNYLLNMESSSNNIKICDDAVNPTSPEFKLPASSLIIGD